MGPAPHGPVSPEGIVGNCRCGSFSVQLSSRMEIIFLLNPRHTVLGKDSGVARRRNTPAAIPRDSRISSRDELRMELRSRERFTMDAIFLSASASLDLFFGFLRTWSL